MNIMKKILMLSVLLFPLYVPAVAAQGLNDDICPPGSTATFCQEDDNTQGAGPNDNRLYGPNGVITRVVRIISLVVGVAAVFMIIVGGIRYITSSGDPNNTNGAKNTILYAIVGLLVAVFAQAIIIFVINKL